MNQKTAKLLNKYSKSTGANPRFIRKTYLLLPKNKRFEHKQMAQKIIDQPLPVSNLNKFSQPE